MASFALLAAGTALKGLSQLKAGDEAKRSLDKSAAEEVRQARVAQSGILEEQRDVVAEGEVAKGAVAARTAGRGLKVAGSARGQISEISRRVARRQEILSKRASDIGLSADINARELKRRGKRARKAGRIGAFGSLLTGGTKLAKGINKAGSFRAFLRA